MGFIFKTGRKFFQLTVESARLSGLELLTAVSSIFSVVGTCSLVVN